MQEIFYGNRGLNCIAVKVLPYCQTEIQRHGNRNALLPQYAEQAQWFCRRCSEFYPYFFG